MPVTANASGFDAKRFAALMAGFDTGNACEAEAMNKARAMRRMVVKAGLRFVDAMERADVKKALDDQLEPIREESAELKEAFRKIRELADLATQRAEMIGRLRQELAEVPRAGQSAAIQQTVTTRDADLVLVNGRLVAAVVLIALALLIAALIQ